jgi:hypothetical protein
MCPDPNQSKKAIIRGEPVRGLLLIVAGWLVGTIVAVLMWFIIAIVVFIVTDCFYPGTHSDVMGDLPSGEKWLTFCALILILPFTAILGGSMGVTRAQRIEARCVLQSLRNGLIATFREDGTRFAETTYHRGVIHGPYRDYWPNSNVACEGQYANGLQDGDWRYYDSDGSLRMTIHFSNGREIKQS